MKKIIQSMILIFMLLSITSCKNESAFCEDDIADQIKIVDAASGQPIKDAVVMIRCNGLTESSCEGNLSEVYTDHNGIASWPCEEGVGCIKVTHPDYWFNMDESYNQLVCAELAELNGSYALRAKAWVNVTVTDVEPLEENVSVWVETGNLSHYSSSPFATLESWNWGTLGENGSSKLLGWDGGTTAMIKVKRVTGSGSEQEVLSVEEFEFNVAKLDTAAFFYEH